MATDTEPTVTSYSVGEGSDGRVHVTINGTDGPAISLKLTPNSARHLAALLLKAARAAPETAPAKTGT